MLLLIISFVGACTWLFDRYGEYQRHICISCSDLEEKWWGALRSLPPHGSAVLDEFRKLQGEIVEYARFQAAMAGGALMCVASSIAWYLKGERIYCGEWILAAIGFCSLAYISRRSMERAKDFARRAVKYLV